MARERPEVDGRDNWEEEATPEPSHAHGSEATRKTAIPDRYLISIFHLYLVIPQFLPDHFKVTSKEG